jgi:hypothetical protein
MNEEVLEPTQEVTEAPLTPSEPAKVTEEAPKAKKAQAVKESAPCCVRAEAGDTYITLGLRHDVDPRDLIRINNNRPIRAGVKVFLKEQS